MKNRAFYFFESYIAILVFFIKTRNKRNLHEVRIGFSLLDKILQNHLFSKMLEINDNGNGYFLKGTKVKVLMDTSLPALGFKTVHTGECNILKISAIKEYPEGSLIVPTKGTCGSAGWDFYVPKYSETFKAHYEKFNKKSLEDCEDNIFIVLKPHERVCIPSGFRVSINPGTALVAWEKSGLATKEGIVPTARVVDEDYQGEVGIGIMNTSSKKVSIKYGQKITQFVHIPYIKDGLEIVDEEKLYAQKSSRGKGGFGSTGV